MPSLDSTFEELRAQLGAPNRLNAAGGDPLFLFAHEPKECLEVREKLPLWTAALQHGGWTVETFSVARLMWEIIGESGQWEEWLELEPTARAGKVADSVGNALRGTAGEERTTGLIGRVAPLLAQERRDTVVLLTDAALVHPFFRVGFFDNKLQNHVKTPTVIFYPCLRVGQYTHRFLGFYPDEGGYRSTLLGGFK